ncbi:molybdate ABC transporter substrate-binding protein [Dyella sp.]|uniref:molybdate ABC transporter substrate-binding protein n=1 Tax=Dyella sp. TaxID=1869338 RepID=UPI002ED5878E
MASTRTSSWLLLAWLAVGPGLAHADDLVVSGASSLTNAFQQVAKAYEAKHPDTHVVLNFAASDVLLQQIANGAPVDVFASADQTAMDKAVQQDVVLKGSRKDFASNQLVLIAPAASTLKISSLRDLTQPSIKRIAAGDPASVPVGRYTQGALAAQGLWQGLSAKTVLAQNVRQSLDYVARDEVDAGFVFATDAAIAKNKVKVIMTVPNEKPITYPLAVIAQSRHQAQAQAFAAFVLSPDGQAVLSQFGFGKP